MSANTIGLLDEYQFTPTRMSPPLNLEQRVNKSQVPDIKISLRPHGSIIHSCVTKLYILGFAQSFTAAEKYTNISIKNVSALGVRTVNCYKTNEQS